MVAHWKGPRAKEEPGSLSRIHFCSFHFKIIKIKKKRCWIQTSPCVPFGSKVSTNWTEGCRVQKQSRCCSSPCLLWRARKSARQECAAEEGQKAGALLLFIGAARAGAARAKLNFDASPKCFHEPHRR